MLPKPMLSEVMQFHVDHVILDGSPHNRDGQRPVEEVGEHGDDVDLHQVESRGGHYIAAVLQDKGVWANYAEGTAGREPMEFLGRALEVTDGNTGAGRVAVDLGCGAGNETMALLERGWLVHAVDAEPRAIEILRSRVPANLLDRLSTEVNLFHEAELPRSDLVFASLSLPFAARDLERSIEVAIGALKPEGWFVGVFFGHNDTWAGEDDVATVDVADIETMFMDFEDLDIDSREFDGPSGAGPKHWHWHLVSARQGVSRSGGLTKRAG
jgi:SAM-dependent methyltransferase